MTEVLKICLHRHKLLIALWPLKEKVRATWPLFVILQTREKVADSSDWQAKV